MVNCLMINRQYPHPLLASFVRPLRRGLDMLYLASGVLGAIGLIAILILIVLQMMARWFGQLFLGAPDYAGYAMAAASFFAFAYALNHGAHIRVSILLNMVSERTRYVLDLWCFAIGSLVSIYVTWFAFRAAYWSWKFHDVSQGQDATPLWIPQSVMVIGSFILSVALVDNLVSMILTGRYRMTSPAKPNDPAPENSPEKS